jgi:hypothetical protein
MNSMDFSITPTLPATPVVLGCTQTLTDISTRELPRSIGRPTDAPLSHCLENVGAPVAQWTLTTCYMCMQCTLL